MTITLTKDDLEFIEGWYQAASGESASYRSGDETSVSRIFSLLCRLGIEPTESDLWSPTWDDEKGPQYERWHCNLCGWLGRRVQKHGCAKKQKIGSG